MTSKKTWLCPIAGNGRRTKQLGHFKPFINVLNKSIFEWFLLSIKDNISPEDDFVFVTTQHFERQFNVAAKVSLCFKKFNLKNKIFFKIVDFTPQGPAKSVELGTACIQKNKNPIVIINVDQFILFKLPELIENTCYLVANIDTGSSKSYIELENKEVIQVIEKINHSNIASAGVYIFPSLTRLQEALKYMFSNKKTHNNEYYVANSMQYLIGQVKFELVPAIAKLDLGTVENIKYFENIISTIKE